jgi:hypothetical protein
MIRRSLIGCSAITTTSSLRFDCPAEYPEGEQVFRGREGFASLLVMLRDVWTEFRFEPERFIDVGDRVVVFIRLVAEGARAARRPS